MELYVYHLDDLKNQENILVYHRKIFFLGLIAYLFKILCCLYALHEKLDISFAYFFLIKSGFSKHVIRLIVKYVLTKCMKIILYLNSHD